MKVSTRVEYGMLALTDIAIYAESGGSVSAPDIAEREGISQKYLEQILTHLKQAGLIRAQKGLRGGYTLSRPADRITIADVLNALDKSILEAQGVPGDRDGRSLRSAVNTGLWEKMNGFLTGFAESRTLAGFVQECREKMSEEWDYYMI